jgi:hypothetical protein
MNPLLEIIEGIPPAQNLNRLQDVEKNIEAVKGEFLGKPLVCHELVKHIIYLRREIDVEENTKCFYALLDEYLDVLLENYNLRWLLSVCDTLVDIGDTAQSNAAMNLVISVNYLNIIITVLDIANDGRPNVDKLKRNPGHKRPTFDGLITADIYEGDMMYNLQKRLNQVAATDELVNAIWKEIKRTLHGLNTVPTNWLTSVHFQEDKKNFYHDDI